jgi:hypothetical protein
MGQHAGRLMIVGNEEYFADVHTRIHFVDVS